MSVSNDKKFPDEEFVKLFIEEINHLVYGLPILRNNNKHRSIRKAFSSVFRDTSRR